MRSKSRELLRNLFNSSPEDINSISQLHSLLLRTGFLPSDNFFATKLVSAYSKLLFVDHARVLFDEISQPNTHLWNAILRAYSRAKQWKTTLDLFRRMKRGSNFHRCCKPDSFTLSIVVKACAGLPAIGTGSAVHVMILKDFKAQMDMFVGSALVEMYAKFGAMGDALKVFEGFPEPDVVLWTSMVTGFQQNGQPDAAVLFFCRLTVEKCVRPDPVTLVSLVSALALVGDLRAGKSCHGFVVRMGFEYDRALANSILHLYAKSGAVRLGKTLFEVMPERDVITWSTMIACYTQVGKAADALSMYRRMNEIGLEPNSVTVLSALQACTLACDLQEGRNLHELAVRNSFDTDAAVSTALIDMYMKCSCHREAADLFNQMPTKDVVSCAAMIGGYAENGLASESLKLFKRMLVHGVNPDAVIMVKVLAACSEIKSFHLALCVHGYIVCGGFDNKVFVSAALVDLHAKCGNLNHAVRVFESVREKDVVLWSSMIEGYGIHGLGSKALEMFYRMTKSSVRPNGVTFISVLSACSHTGMVDKGKKIYHCMKTVYGLEPSADHCNIMVDMLGRSGCLHEALRLIEDMRTPVGPHTWCALLAGCRVHQNIEIGEVAARNLLGLEPNHAGYYNLLSNLYAFEGKWGNAAEIKNIVDNRGITKLPAHSSVAIGI